MEYFRMTTVRCPECKRVIRASVRNADNRFIMPVHGDTREMTCPAGDRPYVSKGKGSN